MCIRLILAKLRTLRDVQTWTFLYKPGNKVCLSKATDSIPELEGNSVLFPPGYANISVITKASSDSWLLQIVHSIIVVYRRCYGNPLLLF